MPMCSSSSTSTIYRPNQGFDLSRPLSLPLCPEGAPWKSTGQRLSSALPSTTHPTCKPATWASECGIHFPPEVYTTFLDCVCGIHFPPEVYTTNVTKLGYTLSSEKMGPTCVTHTFPHQKKQNQGDIPCIRARTHARTHACMHACMHACAHACTHVCMLPCMHACSLALCCVAYFFAEPNECCMFSTKVCYFFPSPLPTADDPMIHDLGSN